MSPLFGSKGHEEASQSDQPPLVSDLGPQIEAESNRLAQRWPVVSLEGIAYGLWEPEAGFLHARRAVIAAVRRFSCARSCGWCVRTILVAPPAGTAYDAEHLPSFMDRGHSACGVPQPVVSVSRRRSCGVT
jgi:hypothetical protein